MEDLQLLHNMQEQISCRPGHMHSRTRTCMHAWTHRPAALMLPLSQDAFIEKTLPQELLILSVPHLVLQQELSSTWKEKS